MSFILSASRSGRSSFWADIRDIRMEDQANFVPKNLLYSFRHNFERNKHLTFYC